MINKSKGKLEVTKKGKRRDTGISLQKAKKFLEWGDITECAKEVGISHVMASNIMKGRCTNWAFVEKILERAEKNKAIKERAQSF